MLTGLWTEDEFNFAGDFYRIHDAPLRPKPLAKPRPEIFQGGNSMASRRMAARVSNLIFLNGHTLEEARAIAHDVKGMALAEGRVVRGIPASAANARADDQLGPFGCGMNCFIICRDTEEEAREVFRDIVAHADWEAIDAFRQQVHTGAGRSSAEGIGMWADSKGTDFVQQNDGFRPDMIGTPGADRRQDRGAALRRDRSDPVRLPALRGGPGELRREGDPAGPRARAQARGR